MTTCALTMVYRDYWALSQWYAHYGDMLGADRLYIVVHGPDDSVAARCPGANIIHIPREDLTRFDRKRAQLLNSIAQGLRTVYRHVIQTDADELICFDPALYASLPAALDETAIMPALFALGMNLMEMPEDRPIDPARPLGQQRRSVWLSGHYSKAFVTSGQADLMRHGVKVRDRPFREFEFVMPKGVYLVHLKFANLAATRASDDVRQNVATPKDGRDEGLPGDAWKYAPEDTRKLLAEHYARQPTDWDRAEAQAYPEICETHRRIRKVGVIKSRSLKWDTRPDIPDWMAAQLAPLPKT